MEILGIIYWISTILFFSGGILLMFYRKTAFLLLLGGWVITLIQGLVIKQYNIVYTSAFFMLTSIISYIKWYRDDVNGRTKNM